MTAGSLNQTKQYTLPLNATKIYSPFNSAEYSALTWEYTATRDCTAVVSINNAQSQNSGNGSMFLIVSIDNINIFTQSVTFGNNAIPDYSFNRAFACNLAKGQKIKVTREANNVTGQYFSVANGIYV